MLSHLFEYVVRTQLSLRETLIHQRKMWWTDIFYLY